MPVVFLGPVSSYPFDQITINASESTDHLTEQFHHDTNYSNYSVSCFALPVHKVDHRISPMLICERHEKERRSNRLSLYRSHNTDTSELIWSRHAIIIFTSFPEPPGCLSSRTRVTFLAAYFNFIFVLFHYVRQRGGESVIIAMS